MSHIDEEYASFHRHQVNELNEEMSFKMSVKVVASLHVGNNFRDVLYEIVNKCAGDLTTMNVKMNQLW